MIFPLRQFLNILAWAIAVCIFGSAASLIAQAKTVRVGLTDSGLEPPNIMVSVGDTVTWVKKDPGDPAQYVVASYTGEWTSPPITTEPFSYTFGRIGTYYYHGGTDGTIQVEPATNLGQRISIAAPPDGFRFVGGYLLLEAASSVSPTHI